MSSALAVEGRFTLTNFLKGWVESGQLSYKFSVQENPLQPTRVRATFSKPTPESPAASAVAYLYFKLDSSLQQVLGFTVESETHFHSVQDLRFDETILDHVIRRKLLLKSQHLIRLSDEFSSTRVPALMKEKDEEKRDHDREALEEYLLERFQRKDPYNDGRISFQECRDVVYALEFPSISRRDREVFFAFIELDRDDMVDYGALVGIGAQVLDTLLHVPELQSDADASALPTKEEVIEWFQLATRHHQFQTISRLEKILDALRPPPPTPPPVDEAVNNEQEAKNAEIDAENEENEEKEASDVSVEPSSAKTTELYVTRRQLRTSLDAPQLLLSRPEINLAVALAVVTPTGMIPCSQLGELLQHVQTVVFRFQSRCFVDRIDRYLLQQFTTYETSNLQGSSEHLKMRLRQKELRAVAKDMKKLLLTPLQVAHIAAICDQVAPRADLVRYQECIPLIAKYLAREVDLERLQQRAKVLHELHHSSQAKDWDGDSKHSLPDAELVHQYAAEKFEALDVSRAGVVSNADFGSALRDLVAALHMPHLLHDELDVAVITAIGDPMAQGRVNYVYFQQILLPLLERWALEKHTQQKVLDERRVSAEAKGHDDEGNDEK